MTHKELIAALEAADGPSRELDARIYAYSKDAIDWKRDAYEQPNHARYAPRWRTKFIASKPSETDDELPKFTSSIDAALTLVPDGWAVASFEWWIPRADASVTLFETDANGNYDANFQKSARGSSYKWPAICLCIAALRAQSLNT